MRRDKQLCFHPGHIFQCIKVSLDVYDVGNPVLIEGFPGCQTVREIDNAVFGAETDHIPGMPRQREHGKSVGQVLRRKGKDIAGLRHQEFMAQLRRRVRAVQKSRFQDRVSGQPLFDPRCVCFAVCLLLEILVASDMVRMRVRIIDGFQLPPFSVQDPFDLLSRVFVITAVDQADRIRSGPDQADLCGTLDIITVFCYLDQFIHGQDLLFAAESAGSSADRAKPGCIRLHSA